MRTVPILAVMAAVIALAMWLAFQVMPVAFQAGLQTAACVMEVTWHS